MGERENREENKRKEIQYTRNILYVHTPHVVTGKGLQAVAS